MKTTTAGTMPQPFGARTTERNNAPTGQVQELQRRYYRAIAPDCEVRTEQDRCYFRAVAWGCLGMVLPPFLLLSAYYVIKARKEAAL